MMLWPSPSSRRTLAVPIVTILFLASLLAQIACRSVATNVSRELYLNLGAEPATLDPAIATDPGSQQVARMIFLSLVDTDAATAAPEHGLATSWAVSADGLIWEFRLRQDAVWVHFVPSTQKFESMRPVDAQDVVYSVRRVFDPRVGSGFASLFAPLIRGAGQLQAADPKKTSDAVWQQLFANLGVTALDQWTVRFTLTRPASDFPSIVSTWLVRTQPRESVEAGGSVWTEPGALWTDGPYVLESWSHNLEIVLRKNPLYYDAANVRIERIHLDMIADTATALAQYKNGSLDTLDPYDGLGTDDFDNLKDDPIYAKQLHIVPSLCTQYYGFNTSKPPFNDVLVRKAFIAAIDRDTLVSSVVKLGQPARWLARPGVVASLGISDTVGIPFNANAARDYLKQAGYDGKTKRMPAISLVVNENDSLKLIAETIIQMWKTNLGVEVTSTSEDWTKYLQSLHDNTPQIFRLGWCAYVPDAANYVESFKSGSPDNYTHWLSSTFDQTVDAAAREIDLAKRVALYRNAEKQLVQDNAVIAPLWWSTRATLSTPTLQRTYAITDGFERFDMWGFQ
ncbi:MAG: peptide ABC transporter substrate-binding protein [Chloroflexi bacterium]|nr:peptide ABC transporter substrate-binding protein [Chloroflexota bacterium]